jgi:CubicO group peptidase (beta-lactamase class C family)
MKDTLHKFRFSAVQFICLLSFTLAINLAALAQAGGTTEAREAKVDQVFAKWDKADSPGCALAVIKDGAIIYKRGYGMANLDHDIKIMPTTVFHVASVSKQFTAMAIHLLAKQGKLSLDDEVKKYIAEFPDFGQKVTIRHLLHHTSGVRDQWSLLVMSGWRLSEDVVRDDDILDLMARQKELNFKPGDQHLYSNSGYTLMAIIVKRVSGKTLREFADENIFKPLGMTSTFFRDDHAVIVKNQAYGYAIAGENFKLSVPNYDTVGASSLLTTVEDLARWDQNFYDPKVGGSDVIAQMQIPTTLNNGDKIEYAHGLVVSKYKGLKIVEHGGADAGYRSNLLRFPDQKFSVACLCNLANTNPGQLSRQVADIYLADQLQPEATKPQVEAKPVTLTDEQLKSKVGVYWNPITEDFSKITLSDGKMFTSNGGELIPLAENRFRMKTQPTEIIFEANATGKMLAKVMPEGRNPIILEAMEPMTPTAQELKEYAGAYYSEELDSVYRIEVQDDKLLLKRKKNSPATFTPLFKDAFNNMGLGTIRFTRDVGKRVNGMTISAGRIRHLRFVKQTP